MKHFGETDDHGQVDACQGYRKRGRRGEIAGRASAALRRAL